MVPGAQSDYAHKAEECRGRARARPGKTCSRGDARQMNEQPNDATTHTTQNMGLDELPQFADTPQGDVPPEPVSPEAKAAAKRRSNRQFIAILVAMSVMLVVGVGLILYPTVADAWNRHVASRAVAGYVEQVADTSRRTAKPSSPARANTTNRSWGAA